MSFCFEVILRVDFKASLLVPKIKGKEIFQEYDYKRDLKEQKQMLQIPESDRSTDHFLAAS